MSSGARISRRRFVAGAAAIYDQGDNIYIADGVRLRYNDRSPFGTAPPDPSIEGELATIVLGLDQLSTTVPVDAPWRAPHAAQLDGQTLQTYLDKQSATPRFQALASAALRPIFGAEPREVSLAGRIDYEPILPFERDQLTQRYGQGTLTKVAAVYERPFWRAKGLTGSAVATGFPVSFSFDDSPPAGRPGVVFGFVGGDNARCYSGQRAAREVLAEI